MTITQMVQNRQQQRIGELAQKQQGKPHVNPYGTPGMSLNDAGDFRKMVPVDEGVVQQVKQIAFDHMKNGYGVSDGEDISKVIRDYTMSLAPAGRGYAGITPGVHYEKNHCFYTYVISGAEPLRMFQSKPDTISRRNRRERCRVER